MRQGRNGDSQRGCAGIFRHALASSAGQTSETSVKLKMWEDRAPLSPAPIPGDNWFPCDCPAEGDMGQFIIGGELRQAGW